MRRRTPRAGLHARNLRAGAVTVAVGVGVGGGALLLQWALGTTPLTRREQALVQALLGAGVGGALMAFHPEAGAAVAGTHGLVALQTLLTRRVAALAPPAGCDLAPYPGAATDGEWTTDAAGVLHHHRTPGGPRVVMQLSQWSMDPAARGHARPFLAWLAPLLAARGLTGRAAFLLGTYIDNESGQGAQIICWNIGNIKEYGATHPWYRLPTGDAGEPFRAYCSAAAGLDDLLALVRDRYPGPWAQLLGGDPRWYGALLAAGFGEQDAAAGQAEYNQWLVNLTPFWPAVTA